MGKAMHMEMINAIIPILVKSADNFDMDLAGDLAALPRNRDAAADGDASKSRVTEVCVLVVKSAGRWRRSLKNSGALLPP